MNRKKSFADKVAGEKRPTASSGKSQPRTERSHVDQYIASQGQNIHKLKAKDSTGRWAYYFVLVHPLKEKRFMEAIGGKGMIDLESFGTIVASCYGEEPTEDIKDYLYDKYGFEV